MSAERAPSVALEKSTPPRPAQPVRASDADRDRIADLLGQALAEGRLDAEEHSERVDAVYRAKTLAELDRLIRDLPAGQGAVPRPGPGPAAGPAAGPGARSQNVIAVLGGATRRGRRRVGGAINVVAFCGGVDLDLTEAVFEQPQVVVTVLALCGGVDITVPENVALRGAGSGILGGFDVGETEATDPDAPVVIVRGVAVCGGVDARPVPGKRVKNLREG